jgi:hypothetical protein
MLAANTYSGADAVWLCIKRMTRAPLVWQMEQLVESLSVPDYRYERIYLGFDALPSDGGSFRVYLLG